jgi:hypothetical protein
LAKLHRHDLESSQNRPLCSKYAQPQPAPARARVCVRARERGGERWGGRERVRGGEGSARSSQTLIRSHVYMPMYALVHTLLSPSFPKSLTYSLTHSLTRPHTHTHSHTHTLTHTHTHKYAYRMPTYALVNPPLGSAKHVEGGKNIVQLTALVRLSQMHKLLRRLFHTHARACASRGRQCVRE